MTALLLIQEVKPDLLIIWETSNEYNQMIENKVSSIPIIVITKIITKTESITFMKRCSFICHPQ